MNVFLKTVVERLVRTGSLTVTGPTGVSHTFGDGAGEPVHIVVKTRRAERAITLDPTLALPEAFMDVRRDAETLARTLHGQPRTRQCDL